MAASQLYTVTAVKRWSCDSKRVPSIEQIKAVHVFDFDNTLFASPMPNELLWTSMARGRLPEPDYFVNGGWWHDPGILAATGQGVDIEEKRGYAGWWNEEVVHEARQSIASTEILTVLLTGRSEAKFPDLILRILKSKGLNFDLVCLKPAVSPTNVQITTTMQFKSELLRSLIFTYKRSPYFKVWEDRPHHATRFSELFNAINKELSQKRAPIPRAPVSHTVIRVKGMSTTLDELTEICQIQRMINMNNKAIAQGAALKPTALPLKLRKEIAYTAYVVMSEGDRLGLHNLVASRLSQDLVQWPPTLLIQPGPAPGPLRSYIGEVGTSIKLRVVAVASWQNKTNRMLGVRVEPIPGSYGFQSSTNPPIMLLASTKGFGVHNGSLTNKLHAWTSDPLPIPFEVEATIAERVMLDFTPELPPSQSAQEPPRKKQRRNENATEPGRSGIAPVVDIHQADFISLDAGPEPPAFGQPTHSRRYDNYHPPQSISANTGPGRGRGGRGGYRDQNSGRFNDRRNDHHRGRGNFRGGRGRGRGAYRSFDDVEVRQNRANAGGPGYRDYDAPGGANGQRDFDY